MATYPGMNLSGEIRESISLDDDDLSDVEDEVFIRDGKARFKYSEDIGLKRPLMAPRRKLITKPDFKSRLRNRPPCRPYCKPCCYFCGGLLVILGLIVLVVIIVSMFPLPIDKMKSWIVPKSKENATDVLLPCSELKVTNVWTLTLPKLTSESSIRAVDIDKDGIEDVIFGFGTGDSRALPDEIFCPMFVGVASPCGGGVIALNGRNGSVIWKKHLPYVVQTVYCSGDLDGDGINDCLITGNKGMLLTISSKDSNTIWEFINDADKAANLKIDIYAGNFIPDQDKDGVLDILVAHTYQKESESDGHLILISGKTGKEITRVSTPNNVETYYIPQLLPQNDGQYLILLGTGSPSSRGNLTTISLSNLLNGTAIFNTIFEHKASGVISPSILVDITGDGQLDIISALFNRTIVAINGATFKQIWNVTVNNSETLSIPTPGFFNDDNVTDFLVKYQTGPGFPVYYYSQTFVINGVNGEIINSSFVEDSVGSQMGGLTLSTERHGYDFFLYWTADCKNFEGRKDKFAFLNDATLAQLNYADLCRLRFNSTKVTKLYALNQYDQPPGMEIYSSDNMIDTEYNNTKTPLEEAMEYLKQHPEVQVQKSATFEEKQTLRPNVQQNRAQSSSFRHKFDDQGLLKNFAKSQYRQKAPHQQITEKYDDYQQLPDTLQKMYYPMGNLPQPGPDDEDAYNSYDDEVPRLYNDNKDMIDLNNRDTRGDATDANPAYKKDLGKHGIYSPQNIEQSRKRLLNDLNSSPTEILKDTYFKNLEHQLRKSRFEQRDLKAHHDKMKDNEEIRKVINEEKQRALNVSVNLWDLETEKEMEDRKHGYARGKRNSGSNITQTGVPLINSIGILVKSLDPTLNAVDLIYLTYWIPSKPGPAILLEKDFECIENKLKNAKSSKEEIVNVDQGEVKLQYQKECLNERGAFQLLLDQQDDKSRAKFNIPYNNEISEVSLGQLTVYRVRIECVRCNIQNKGERCAKFLNPSSTNNVWSAYLNRRGNGVFRTL